MAELRTTLQEIGGTLAAGQRLDEAATDLVVGADDLLGLGALADDCRRLRHGDRATFVRVQEIQATADPASAVEVVPGAGEVRICGEVDGREQALRLVRRVAADAGSVPVTGFALDMLADHCAWDPAALVDLLVDLKHAGLSLLAEARVERVRGPEWFEVVGRAELMVGRLTVGDVSGHRGAELIRRVAGWGTALAHVHAFAPLSRVRGSQPTTGYADLRQVALARVLVDNIDSIQVDWGLFGPKLAQVALMFGADDVDTVSPLDTLELGWRRSPLEEITRNIRASALVPVQRNGRFEALEG